MAGDGQLFVSISSRFDGECIPNRPVSAYLIRNGCQVDNLSTPSIHSLTHSRLRSGLISAFSVVSFIVGVVTIVTTWAERL
jgi:hypothetical protein